MAPEFEDYLVAVRSLNCGKRAGQERYLHRSNLPEPLARWVRRAQRFARLEDEDFNVIKFSEKQPRLSLLNYPTFFEEGFPTLWDSWSVSLDTEAVSRRHYPPISNAPVLHRKELLLAADHPERAGFEALTAAAEAAGLFADTQIIGHRVQWGEELRARGLKVEGNQLLPRTPDDEDDLVVVRHRTAIRRSTLSTPMQGIWRHGYLEGKHTLFDYGCGRGDDLRALQERNIESSGWDPHFRPEGELKTADVVNLGFVINVIENPRERRAAVVRAYSLAKELLVVAALIGGRTAYERHRLHSDGVLTSIGTFQKYFTQAELGEYLRETLERDPIAIAPGTYFVFKDDSAEQQFLLRRRSSRMATPRSALPKPSRLPTTPRQRRQRKPTKWEANADLLQRFWRCCLTLGRLPAIGEFKEEAALQENLGTPKRVLRHLLKEHGEEDWQAVRAQRQADLQVYLALNLFEQRRSFKSLPNELRQDIKEFWGTYSRAQKKAKELLYSAGNSALITKACQDAEEAGWGVIESGWLKLSSNYINDLPSILRVYLGCAEVLYGEAKSADEIKLYLPRSKVRILTYNEEGKLAGVSQQIEIDLRRQNIRILGEKQKSRSRNVLKKFQ